MITADRIQYLIRQGEGYKVDFKSAVPAKVRELSEEVCSFANAGGLLPQVAENFGHKSLSRNPFIFSLFTRMQLVEKVGSGIPRMIGLMKESGLNEPIFSKDGIFSISFPKTIGKFVDATTEKNDSNDNVGINVGINAEMSV